MIKEKIVKHVRPDDIFGFLLYFAVLGRDEFGAYGRCENILEYLFRFAFARLRNVGDYVTDERFRHGRVDAVHRHMIAVIGCPAESEFGQIARSDDKPARFVGDIHQHLSAFSRLRIFVSHVGDVFALTDIFEMASHRFRDINFSESDVRLLG